MQLVLSLFPGIGLLDMAFEQEGFCVVRGPDVLWGGDIRRFHPPAGKFDGVIGGPPCQAFSRLSHMVRHNGYEPKFGNLIPEFERCVIEAQPTWFVMENVPDAPTPQAIGYATWSTLLNNRQCLADDGNPAVPNRDRRYMFIWRLPIGKRLVTMRSMEDEQPKRGRPKIAKPKRFRGLMCTDEEWETWQRVAGARKVSAWIRDLANRAAKRMLRR